MKFILLKEHFERAVSIAERFTGKNVTLPVLGNILVEADESSIKISATNLEYAIQISIPGKGIKKGSVCVPAKTLNSLIQSTKEEKITLEEKQGNLVVSTEQREIKINGLATEDFPLIPHVKKTSFFSIESEVLAEGIGKTLPATSISEFKPELSGIFFQIHGKQGKIAATDTFRLAEKTIELSAGGEGLPVSFILPHKIAQELPRVWGKREEVVKITVGENQVLFECGGIKITSRLIEGSFPEYGGVIPKTHVISCEVARQELIDSVRASSIFASKLQEIKFFFKEKTLLITATNQEVGEYKTTLIITPIKTEQILSFNHRYLLDGLTVLEGEQCFLGLGGTTAPTLLKSVTDPSFIYIVMPIQLT